MPPSYVLCGILHVLVFTVDGASLLALSVRTWNQSFCRWPWNNQRTGRTPILLLLDVLVQLTVLSDMAEPAGNVIPIPATTYPVDILLGPDLVYFKRNRLREFFLLIILHAIGNGDVVAFNVSEDVWIVTVTLFCIIVENFTELYQGYLSPFLIHISHVLLLFVTIKTDCKNSHYIAE